MKPLTEEMRINRCSCNDCKHESAYWGKDVLSALELLKSNISNCCKSNYGQFINRYTRMDLHKIVDECFQIEEVKGR